ncbi:hypothetical protein NM688_g7336 [Phlebia brevispora]|uniref:Uncharacterized protein n=1 Tax=Phlebia brevispora TaxID=194682 RepID=A0ACC1S6M3_9APHY|nr:hypothetical protein NM688_g7336 [Phlebia brevispora]
MPFDIYCTQKSDIAGIGARIAWYLSTVSFGLTVYFSLRVAWDTVRGHIALPYALFMGVGTAILRNELSLYNGVPLSIMMCNIWVRSTSSAYVFLMHTPWYPKSEETATYLSNIQTRLLVMLELTGSIAFSLHLQIAGPHLGPQPQCNRVNVVTRVVMISITSFLAAMVLLSLSFEVRSWHRRSFLMASVKPCILNKSTVSTWPALVLVVCIFICAVCGMEIYAARIPDTVTGWYWSTSQIMTIVSVVISQLTPLLVAIASRAFASRSAPAGSCRIDAEASVPGKNIRVWTDQGIVEVPLRPQAAHLRREFAQPHLRARRWAIIAPAGALLN